MTDDDVKELKGRRAILIIYLKMKVKDRDWHAVADAAMDLREMEIRILESRKND